MKATRRFQTVMFAMFLGIGLASAQTPRTWVGGPGGAWSEPANWDPTGEPQAGDSVTVDDGASVILSQPTAALASFTLENATLTFTNWNTTLYAGTVTIGDDAVVTLPGPFDEGGISNRIHIVCTDFILAADGVLDADGMGYNAGHGDGKGETSQSRQSGGGYGGRGGDGGNDYMRRPIGGAPYGSAVEPVHPGSGGGVVSTLNGPGGGAIRISANHVMLNGEIRASGTPATRSCGSGGSILIETSTLSGTGSLRAHGGTPETISEYWNPGGGGRIAIHYDTVAPATDVTIDTRTGLHGWPFIDPEQFEDRWMYRADLGTIWLSDTTLLNDGEVQNLYGQIIVPGFDTWTVDSLSIEDSAIILGNTNGFTLNVENDAQISGEGAYLQLARPADNPWPVVNTGGVMNVGGSLTLTDDARLQIFAGATNLMQTSFGGELTVGNALILEDESRLELVSHPVDGGSVRIRCATVTVAELARITAHGRGYAYMEGPGAGFVSGRGGGGGYGGHGGRATGGNWGSGSAYGEPGWVGLQIGSGGGVQSGYRGGFGGGLIWLEVDGVATIDGTLSANGNWTSHAYGGGGSGGGIFLVADRLLGAETARLKADGGNAVYWTDYGGGGGGGRIAVWTRTAMESIQALADTGDVQGGLLVVEPDPPPTFNGTTSVEGGLGWADNQDPPPDEEEFAAQGSINYLRIVFRGSLIRIR